MAASPVYAFRRQPTMVDYPGRIAAIFFTSGCNFSCGFCHNATLMGAPRPGLSWERMDEVCADFRRNWTDAAVISGGEPTLAAGLPELIRFYKRHGFAVKLDTNGSNPEMLEACLPDLDYVAMDVKTALEDYPSLTGWSRPDRLRRSVELLRSGGVRHEFRTTVIPGHHNADRMRRIGIELNGSNRLVLQPFVPDESLPGETFRTLPRTPPEQLEELRSTVTEFVHEVVVRGGGG
ncbi:anaerobic ribonucleoside-triphosphate reductase activating protein [Kiritimatiella glycovorans]|uniref:7-carboxy-7-deazaguanine synthase n=1 Tax=Kiritimatiella glycovorans TaxID=1307763 RepID=A0A0G3EK70_9BACT|nr:anaerobic ribonucleoside-triphosphate reductase activating protein [Kiritimatiella glycovorans]AKJ64559.1 7-carboxy-7-deazaguanine synthase [Kiritimatiella glycovorans]